MPTFIPGAERGRRLFCKRSQRGDWPTISEPVLGPLGSSFPRSLPYYRHRHQFCFCILLPGSDRINLSLVAFSSWNCSKGWGLVRRSFSKLTHQRSEARRGIRRVEHPCGIYEWQVMRLGADIGIRCRGCNRRVLLERRDFERRVKEFISRGEQRLAVE